MSHEIKSFLYSVTPDDIEPRFYHPSQVTRAEQDAGLVCKRASTTARQANLPINHMKWDCFWSMEYPYDICGINAHSIID